MTSITINSGTDYRPAEWYQQHGMDITRFAEFHMEMEDICISLEEAGIRWSYTVKVAEWDVNEYGEASLGYDIVIEAECSDEELRNSLDICLLPGE